MSIKLNALKPGTNSYNNAVASGQSTAAVYGVPSNSANVPLQQSTYSNAIAATDVATISPGTKLVANPPSSPESSAPTQSSSYTPTSISMAPGSFNPPASSMPTFNSTSATGQLGTLPTPTLNGLYNILSNQPINITTQQGTPGVVYPAGMSNSDLRKIGLITTGSIALGAGAIAGGSILLGAGAADGLGMGGAALLGDGIGTTTGAMGGAAVDLGADVTGAGGAALIGSGIAATGAGAVGGALIDAGAGAAAGAAVGLLAGGAGDIILLGLGILLLGGKN